MDEKAKEVIRWNWPDEQLRNEPRRVSGSKLKEAAKMVFFFADDVLILAFLIYLLFRLLS